jgi:hypothetical protein
MPCRYALNLFGRVLHCFTLHCLCSVILLLLLLLLLRSPPHLSSSVLFALCRYRNHLHLVRFRSLCCTLNHCFVCRTLLLRQTNDNHRSQSSQWATLLQLNLPTMYCSFSIVSLPLPVDRFDSIDSIVRSVRQSVSQSASLGQTSGLIVNCRLWPNGR